MPSPESWNFKLLFLLCKLHTKSDIHMYKCISLEILLYFPMPKCKNIDWRSGVVRKNKTIKHAEAIHIHS